MAHYNKETGETLITVHTFGGELPEPVRIPVQGGAVRDVLCSENNAIALENGQLEIELNANFEAVAVLVAD